MDQVRYILRNTLSLGPGWCLNFRSHPFRLPKCSVKVIDDGQRKYHTFMYSLWPEPDWTAMYRENLGWRPTQWGNRRCNALHCTSNLDPTPIATANSTSPSPCGDINCWWVLEWMLQVSPHLALASSSTSEIPTGGSCERLLELAPVDHYVRRIS